jgi:hypothetical protein
MIILTYISGLMTALLAGLLFFAILAYRKYSQLLELNDESNIYNFERYEEMKDWMEKTEGDLNYIKEGMEKNDYDNMKSISDNVEKLNQRLNIANQQTIHNSGR